MSVLPRVPGIELVRLLGSGGMGAVYLGRETAAGRTVAVKVLLTDHPSESSRRRFEREARAMMHVRHPNVCQAFDFGQLDSGRLYIVLERLRGEDLGARLARVGRLPLADAVRIGREAAAGVTAAHRAGLLHRDIKPSNLFLHQERPDEPPTVKVVDFGLAVFALDDATDTRVTRTGEVLGTPAFMSPEQARGDRSEDERTDVYSLAAVLYRCLTGSPPFGRGTALEVLVRLLTDEPRPIGELRPATPTRLREIVMQGLAKLPADRQASVAALADQLEAVAPVVAGAQALSEPSLQAVVERHEAPTLIGERRVLTVMIATGVDDVRTVVTHVERQGGRATALGGGQVVGLFGGEVLEGDEAARAVRAALAAGPHAAVIGVGTGRAEGGAGHFSGDAINAAEAVTAVLDAGIVLDAETRRRVAGRFVLEGNKVHGEVDEDASGRVELPFIGRDVEAAELNGAVERAFEDEEPSAALVLGPAGIGRSRLLREVVRGVVVDEPDCVAVEVACHHADRYKSWGLVGAALRAWGHLQDASSPSAIALAMERLAANAGLDAESGHILAAVAGVPLPLGVSAALDAARGDAQVMRDRVVHVVGDLIEVEADERPLLLAFDDVQWADTPSLELMDVLLHRLVRARLAILMTARSYAERDRPELFGSPQLRKLPLRELSRKASSRLVVAAGVEEEVARAISDHAGGNPLFLEEIAEATRAGRFDSTASGVFRLPLTVEEAVQARLDHLAPLDKDLIKRASVFGIRFWHEGLESVGASDIARALRRLRRENIVAPARRRDSGGLAGWEFRTGVMRDVAYGMLTESQRSTLHYRIGDWLRTADVGTPAAAAEHLSLSGHHVDAVPLWREAADVARLDGDIQAALRCLEKALEGAVGTAMELPVRLLRFEHSTTAGDRAVSEEELRAIDAMGVELTAEQEAEKRYWLAGSLRWRAQYTESVTLLEEAASQFQALGDDRGRSRALASLAVSKVMGRLGPAADISDASIEAAGTDAMARARALQARVHVALYEGDRSAVRQYAVEALEACEVARDLRRSLEVMITLTYWDRQIGFYERAEGRLREIVQRSQRIGSRNAEGYALHNLGYTLLRMGRAAEGLAIQDQALALALENEFERLRAGALVYRALTLLELDRTDEAAAAGEEAVTVCAGGAEEPLARTAMALVCLKRGDAAAGLEQTGRALALRDEVGSLPELEPDLLLAHADLLVMAGRVEEAGAWLAQARDALIRAADEMTATPEERTAFVDATPAHRRIFDMTLIDSPSFVG